MLKFLCFAIATVIPFLVVTEFSRQPIPYPNRVPIAFHE